MWEEDGVRMTFLESSRQILAGRLSRVQGSWSVNVFSAPGLLVRIQSHWANGLSVLRRSAKYGACVCKLPRSPVALIIVNRIILLSRNGSQVIWTL